MPFEFETRLADSPFITGIWCTRSDTSGTFISHAISSWELVTMRYQGQTMVAIRGPESIATQADYPSDAEFFGIQFRLGTFMPHLPNSALVDSSATLPEASAKRIWLHGASWEMPTFENADVFVQRLIKAELLVHEPVVARLMQGENPYLSVRAVQRRFLRATGLTYATVRQIERAQQAQTLLQEGVAIMDVVSRLGYADQPHLTRSLKRYMGQTPAQIITNQPLPHATTAT